MWGKSQGVNWVAFVSTCWGLLLTSVTFVGIVSSATEFGPSDDTINFALICQASIMVLGCIQTLFSAVLFFAPPKRKHSWTTVWICAHIVIILGLVLFYSFHTYAVFWAGDISANEEDDQSQESLLPVQSSQFTTLDATVLFDFLFLTIIFVSMLCEVPKQETDEEDLVGSRVNSYRGHPLSRHLHHNRRMSMSMGINKPVASINEEKKNSCCVNKNCNVNMKNPAPLSIIGNSSLAHNLPPGRPFFLNNVRT